MNRHLFSLVACLAALGCSLKAPTTTPKVTQAEGVVRNGVKATVVKGASPVPDAFFGRPGGALISNNGSTVISNNAGNLIGQVKAPAGLISNNGGSIISNNGSGYRTLATSEVPVAGVEVLLVGADGTPVTDAKGAVITTKTDAQGRYKLKFSGASNHLVVRVALPAQKGSLLAFVAKRDASGDRTVDLNLNSTLVMGYILGQYVKGDPQILEKLPEDVEAETRRKMADALDKSEVEPPTALTSEQIGKTVDALREADATIDDQMEKVKRLLLVGLSDQGAGKPALSVETDAVALAVSPSGEVFYGGLNTHRIWRRDAQGLLRPYAGTGASLVAGQRPGPDQPAPGDGGPATQASIYPTALAFDSKGNLYVGDPMLRRVRKIDATGTITTLAAQSDWSELRALAVAPDDTLYVATKTAIDRVGADKAVTRVAGGASGKPAAGPVSSLRFQAITDLAVEPTSGDLHALDESGFVVRLAGDAATIAAGTGTRSFSGDGGAATSATFSGTGGIDFAPDGALLMADLGNRRLRRVKDGTMTTIAGTGVFGFKGDGGAATAAGMCNPRSVAVGRDGTVYTADIGFVRQVKDGTIATIIGQTAEAGAQPVEEVQLRNPKGLVYDAASHSLLIAELWRVRKWNLGTNRVETIASAGLSGAPFQEGGAPTASTLFNFYGLAMGPEGALTYLAEDVGFKRRLLRQAGGKLTTLAGNGEDTSLFGLLLQFDGPAIDAAIPSSSYPVAAKGELAYYGIHLAGTMNKAVILQVTPGGNVSELCRVDSGAPALGLAVTPDGSGLIIGGLSKLYRYDFATKQSVELTKDGGPSTPTALGLPTGFAWDASGNMYFADYAVGRVRRLNKADGTVTNVAGKGTALLSEEGVDGGLTSPWGVAIDKDGNLYVSDMNANQVKKIPANQLPQ